MQDKNFIKIILGIPDNGTVSLRKLLSTIGNSVNFAEINLKIEILPEVKIYLIDDLFDSKYSNNLQNIHHDIDITLNSNSWLEYQICLKQNQNSTFMKNLIFDKKLKLNFVGEDSYAKARIKSVCSGNQRISFYTEQNHLKSRTASCLCIKAILFGKAALFCNNKIFVDKKLDTVFSKQMNKNLLLTENANISTVPQLEILSDNVKCKHGAIITKLDEEQLFYLKSRGLNLTSSKALLCKGFLNFWV